MHMFTDNQLQPHLCDFFCVCVARMIGKDSATFSFDGEKQTPAVGAECCFNQDICGNESKLS